MAAGDPYSRVVGWLKVALPLAALALLSTLFLFARRDGSEGDIPFAEIEAIARDPRISAPTFSGVTEDGATVSLSAQTIRADPASPDVYAVLGIAAAIVTAEGASISVTAAQAALDGRAERLDLDGLARLDTSTGYHMETRGLVIDLAAGTLDSRGALEIRAPFGALTAGRLHVGPGEGSGQVLDFTGGVRLLYDPQAEEPAP